MANLDGVLISDEEELVVWLSADKAGIPESLPKSDVVRVNIGDLRDCESARSEVLDQEHARVLAQLEARLPPITVHFPTMRVVDGVHRVAAARMNGQTEIDARFCFGSLDDAFRIGVMANVSHGLPLSLGDRKAAARRIIGTHPHLSDRAVAKTAGLSPKTVAAVRAELPDDPDEPALTRIGADGRQHPLNTAVRRLVASQVIESRPEASLREIAREAGISVATASDVRKRMAQGEDPVPLRTRSARRSAPSPALPVDISSAMARLHRDPGLRYTDSGRRLLRWLDMEHEALRQLGLSTSAVPSHCHAALREVAREYSRRWSAFADGLDED